MKKFVGVFVVLTLLILPGFSLAKEDARDKESKVTLETITVTAEKFPVLERESSRFVTVISAEELKETSANNLVDALKRKGGFAYKAYGPLGLSHGGMNSKLSVRGIYDGELVLINGVPIQGPAGHGYDLDMIPIDQIERVEILKGAASTLYGADAMTGVINIITKKNVAEPSVKIYTEMGDYEYHNHGLSFLSPKLNIGLNYSHLGSIEEISRSFTKKYRYDTDDTNKYSMNLNAKPFEDFYIDYMGSYNETGYKKIKDSGGLSTGTDQYHYKHFANIRYENASLRLKTFYSYNEMQRDEYTNPSKPEDNNKNYNYGFEGGYKFNFLTSELNIGADYVYRGADYNNQYGKHHRNDYAAFFQIKKDFFDRLAITLGAREQFVKADSNGKDYDRFLPSLGLNFKAADTLNFFANTGKAFRSPTFNNLYYSGSFLVGNSDLDPEEGWTYEVGIKFDNDFFRLRLAGFYMDYRDKIEIDRSHGYPLTYFNAGDYETVGIEWDASIYPFAGQSNLLRNLSLDTAGYWADPEAEDTSGEQYQAGPKFQTSLGISYLTEKITLNLLANILISRERGLDDYATVDFYSKYRLFRGYLTIGVDNIFNEEIHISGDMSSDSTNNYVYYGFDRLFKLGYEITF
ncbi:MAG: TonB-dependent receptor [Desulfobacteraceae bacterium]|nr:TonB-dependent receptor [Desulfobacteraceae bacterium]MBC2718416.1 TonB-dependent receptor [Desulfobacteraceae bacterium]